MKATVAICTHNRANYLARAIRSVLGQRADVLVVDNASTDDTSVVVNEFPHVRYVQEPTVGLSHARNRALQEAAGEVVLFLDDDAVASDGWVAALSAAFESPAVAAAGGPITLTWPAGKRPGWFPAALDGLFAGLDLGPGDLEIAADMPGPFGANMAVRRDVVLGMGGFNPDLGRSGTSLAGNEETHLWTRLRDEGHTIRYAAGASVAHAVVEGRDNLRYVLRRQYAGGQSSARSGGASATPREIVGHIARVVTARGGGQWGRAGSVAGLAWLAEDIGRLRG